MGRGDHLYIRPHEGDGYIRKNFMAEQIVTIDGQLWVRDPYKMKHPGIRYDYRARGQGILPPETSDFGPIRVPEGQFFMVGDNRDHSNDSRFWGSVPYRFVVGKPWFIYFSWDSRSYTDIAKRGIFLTDYEALERVCGELDPLSSACETRWEQQRYKIRWDRIGQGIRDLERLIHE
jgi:signal peptidase I